MKRISTLILFAALLFLGISRQPFAADQEEISILVDGLPLDARGLKVNREPYVPAWILENYGNTRIMWKPGDSILEINTFEPESAISKMEGTMRIRIGFYSKEEGFIAGKNTPVHILNINPASLEFESGASLHQRAHQSTISRLQIADEKVLKYLDLSPPERYHHEGLEIISQMERNSILGLDSIIARYESLYGEFYYDLLSTLVFEKEKEISESPTISVELKELSITKVDTDDAGHGSITLRNGTHFVFCRMHHKGKLIIWNLPVTITGSDISLELTNRNVTFVK